MRKQRKYIIIAIIVILVSFFILEHAVLVSVTKTIFQYAVSLETHMNRIILNPFKGSITVRGLKIFNSKHFKDRLLASIPLIKMDFNAKTLFEKGIFYDTIVIHIKELNIIRNEDDIVNLAEVKALTPQKKPKEPVPFNADSCIIEIDKVRYIDYTKEDEDRIREIDLNIKEEYKGLKNANNIARAIAFKIFFDGKLGNIGVDIQKIQKDLARLAENNEKLKKELTEFAQAQIEKAKEIAVEQVEKAKEAIKDKVDDIKEEINKNNR